jgi:hypothetical protein
MGGDKNYVELENCVENEDQHVEASISRLKFRQKASEKDWKNVSTVSEEKSPSFFDKLLIPRRHSVN